MATVITNLLSAIPFFGQDLVELIWGGFSVSNATLNRFFSLHYLLPFLLAALVVAHLIALHTHGLDFFGPNLIFMKSLTKISLAFILPNFSPKTRIGPHNEEVYSVLIGSILGDCHAERLPSGGVRFIFKQSAVHKDYLFWLFDFFRHRGYCTNNLPVKSTLKSGGDKYYEFYRFNTFTYSSLLDIYKLFYTSTKKKVIPNNIEELLTPLALAIWLMDDGTFKSPGLRIATNCFKKQEVELLGRALDNKFNIKSSLHYNNAKYQLYIKKESMPLLKKLVLPHIVPSMLYKLGL